MTTETAAALACRHATLRLTSHEPTSFVDLTTTLEQFVASTGIRFGTLCVQTRHTTTGLVVNEGERQLLTDFETLLTRMAPSSATYAHDDLRLRPEVPPHEPRNGHAHCRALLLPTSVTINVVEGSLALGRWQRILFVELDGPRERQVSALVMGGAL
jgi:secondary thiamine-phosphate synthase enzyme